MEFGTPNMVGIASLWAAQDWIREQGGIDVIHEQEMKLAQQLVDGLRKIEGVVLYCCDSLENHIATITINVDGMEAGNVGIILDVDHNIATRTGLHCAPLVHKQLGIVEIHGGVRFGIGPFNTDAHIKAAVDGVADVAEQARKIKKVNHQPSRS
jgi:selenocysteine lyase/cysteine desulfurase